MIPKGRFWQMAFVWTVLAVVVSQTALATCTGSTPRHACKNCQHCKHCAKDKGTCGVCKRSA